MNEKIYLSKADVTEVEERFVIEALRSGWIAPLGPDVDAFEEEVAAQAGVGHALALSSGTAALHLALLELGAGPGSVVIVPTMTFAATANAVAYTGAQPVFVDAKLSDGNVDPDILFDAIKSLKSEGQTIAAALSVDLFGRCADYDEILRDLGNEGVPLIEDAAEAIGAKYKSGPAGSFGRAGAFSFNGNKIMTTSGGGMLVSDDAALISRCRYLSTQARQPLPWYEHVDVGYNYRMSNLLAALGRAQLTRLPSLVERRKNIRRTYRTALAGIAGLSFLGDSDPRTDDDDNAWLTVVTIDPSTGADPDSVVAALSAKNIEARHVWKPMHLQPIFANAKSFLNGASEELFKTGVALPSGATLSQDDVTRVALALREVLERS